METSGQRSRTSDRSVSAGTMANEVSAGRFAAAIVAIGTLVSALILVTRTTVDSDGVTVHPDVGQAIAVVAVGFGLTAILLFLAAWAEAWRDAQLD
jgi:hypothetical protein